MKKLGLGATDPSQYDSLTTDERNAWLFPEAGSYHSLHVERMGAETLRWRDSRTAHFYIGTLAEFTLFVAENLTCRKVDPQWSEHRQTLRILSAEEIDDLLKDL